MSTLTDFVVSTVFSLADATIPIPLPYISSISLLSFLHAVQVSQAYRNILKENHVRIGWFQGLFAIVMMAAGGGSTVCLLRGEPIGILGNDAFWAVYG
jgi:xanthosine utilization system XapX-like protein